MEHIEPRIILLESKVAFQEDTIEKLNQIITDQQYQLDQLRTALINLKEWALAQQQFNIAAPNQETPPPHY